MKTSRSNKKYKKKVQYMKTKYNIKISNVEKQKEISEIQIWNNNKYKGVINKIKEKPLFIKNHIHMKQDKPTTNIAQEPNNTISVVATITK